MLEQQENKADRLKNDRTINLMLLNMNPKFILIKLIDKNIIKKVRRNVFALAQLGSIIIVANPKIGPNQKIEVEKELIQPDTQLKRLIKNLEMLHLFPYQVMNVMNYEECL